MSYIRMRRGQGPQPISVWWIGDTGGCIPVDPRFAEGSPLYPFNTSDTTTPFRKLGWMRLGLGQNRVQLWFSASFVSSLTVDSALSRLRAALHRPTRLLYDVGITGEPKWTIEDLPSPRAACHRLKYVVEEAGAVPIRATSVVTRPIVNISQQEPLLMDAFEAWRADPSGNSLRQNLGHQILETFAANEHAPDCGLTFKKIGVASDSAKSFGAKWQATSIGAPYVGSNELTYDRRAVEGYVDVARTRRPRLDFVDAVFPGPTGLVQRTRYQRLLLPLSGKGHDNTIVTVARFPTK